MREGGDGVSCAVVRPRGASCPGAFFFFPADVSPGHRTQLLFQTNMSHGAIFEDITVGVTFTNYRRGNERSQIPERRVITH